MTQWIRYRQYTLSYIGGDDYAKIKTNAVLRVEVLGEAFARKNRLDHNISWERSGFISNVSHTHLKPRLR